MLCALIILLGAIVGNIESWKFFNAIYWAFITALTVGYGDIRPLHKVSRVLSVIIALIGIMLAGIVVAITVECASIAFDKHVDRDIIERIRG